MNVPLLRSELGDEQRFSSAWFMKVYSLGVIDLGLSTFLHQTTTARRS